MEPVADRDSHKQTGEFLWHKTLLLKVIKVFNCSLTMIDCLTKRCFDLLAALCQHALLVDQRLIQILGLWEFVRDRLTKGFHIQNFCFWFCLILSYLVIWFNIFYIPSKFVIILLVQILKLLKGTIMFLGIPKKNLRTTYFSGSI